MDFCYSQSSQLHTGSFGGAILLDVENLPFKLDLAKYLQAYCLYPITIKFAVANWQNNSISRLDKYLHQQGYQLIHVPKGKNAADGQLLTLGASLLLNYPQIKEVAIASQDSIFNYLHQTLRAQRCNTYKIYHHSGNIYIEDYETSKSSVITKVENTLGHSSVEQDLQNKIESIIYQLSQKDITSVTLSQVSQQFKSEYNKSISEILKLNQLAKSPLNFITKECSSTINIKKVENAHYLVLKDK